ncbi:hypothetical protein B296_00042077 [Ensete ventricosum]|uniref:Uncharacterized protein n=1 Tax=Ensete ventricosum TaxID=4639 RepID=A0A426XE99_ENSVE|nr:hypothetical protein B296_00042077 [Ensete ventricosum]
MVSNRGSILFDSALVPAKVPLVKFLLSYRFAPKSTDLILMRVTQSGMEQCPGNPATTYRDGKVLARKLPKQVLLPVPQVIELK